MTHDELLAKLNSSQIFGKKFGVKAYLALCAIVELHKPVEGKFGLSCLKCRDYENYPCSTIQAIEKELV